MVSSIKATVLCNACEKTLKSYKYLKRHRGSVKHKRNVIKKYPEALMYKNINGIKIETGRIDLTKEYSRAVLDPEYRDDFIEKLKKQISIPVYIDDIVYGIRMAIKENYNCEIFNLGNDKTKLVCINGCKGTCTAKYTEN